MTATEIDIHELSRALRRIKQHMHPVWQADLDLVDGPGGALITLDAAHTTAYPSSCPNAVTHMGCAGPVSEADISGVVDMFESAGVERFFFWLFPCQQEEQIASWLQAAGLTRFRGTRYPTLLRRAEALPPHETPLVVRPMNGADAAGRLDQLEEVYGPSAPFFVASCGRPDVQCFVATHEDRVVSAGVLCVRGEVGYLGWMATAEAYRGRGGQNALIRARVSRAAAVGCRWACSETLTFLEGSLRNLQRNGFEVVDEKRIYQWKPG